MGIYNVLLLNTACPRCGEHVEIEAQFQAGRLDLLRYEIGDRIIWNEGGEWQGEGVKKPGTRPSNGDWEPEAYAVCPRCSKDFFIDVTIRGDMIVSAVADDRTGYL